MIADTHMPRGRRRLPAPCMELIGRCDALIHAGDFFAASVLAELRAIAPVVHAVHGNVDDAGLRGALPAELEVDFEGNRVAVIHDAGAKRGRLERLRARFPEADAVVFGHSHMPEHLVSDERDDPFQIFNPGSPTERRRAPHRSMGLMQAGPRGLKLAHVRLP